MKLLVITHSYFPAFRNGGPIISVHSLNKSLASLGVDISVITTNAGLEDDNEIPLNSWTDVDGIKVKYCPYYGGQLYNISPHMVAELLRIIKGVNLVYITPVWNFPNLMGALVSHMFRKPYIISPRGTLYREAIELRSGILKKIYYNLIVRHMLKRAHGIHFTTEDEKNKVLDYLKINKNNFVISNGIDLAQFKVLPPKGCFKKKYPQLIHNRYILFLGRINEKKGLDILVHAFRLLSEQYADLFLVIAGFDNDGYLKTVKELIGKTNISDKVIIPGPLVGKSKLEAYVDADLFVLPSYSENFGMAVIEAMACGCPVVLTNKVGIHETISANELGLVSETNVKSLKSCLNRVLLDGKLQKKFSKSAKEYVIKHFSSNSISSEILSKFKDILKDPPSN